MTLPRHVPSSYLPGPTQWAIHTHNPGQEAAHSKAPDQPGVWGACGGAQVCSRGPELGPHPWGDAHV